MLEGAMHDEKRESPRGRRLLLQVGLICGLGGVLFGVVMSKLMSRRACSRAHPPCQRFARPAMTIPRVPPVPPLTPAFNPSPSGWQCQAAPLTSGRLRRVFFDGAPAFSMHPTRIDFERTPDGKVLHPGDDVEHAYAARGLALSTSIDSSYVG